MYCWHICMRRKNVDQLRSMCIDVSLYATVCLCVEKKTDTLANAERELCVTRLCEKQLQVLHPWGQPVLKRSALINTTLYSLVYSFTLIYWVKEKCLITDTLCNFKENIGWTNGMNLLLQLYIRWIFLTGCERNKKKLSYFANACCLPYCERFVYVYYIFLTKFWPCNV